MKHARHDMHVNSLFSWRMLNVPRGKARVCEVLERIQRPLTDREVCELLGSDDLNAARPRITELIDDGVLKEVESIPCPVTGRRVRKVWFA